MPRFDFCCPLCHAIKPDVWVTNWASATGEQMPQNCDCGGEMEKVPAAPNFAVKGYNAKNHYGAKRD